MLFIGGVWVSLSCSRTLISCILILPFTSSIPVVLSLEFCITSSGAWNMVFRKNRGSVPKYSIQGSACRCASLSISFKFAGIGTSPLRFSLSTIRFFSITRCTRTKGNLPINNPVCLLDLSQQVTSSWIRALTGTCFCQSQSGYEMPSGIRYQGTESWLSTW